MRARLALAVALSLVVLLLPGARLAGDQEPAAGGTGKAEPLPGVELARVLATATGIAITPLLGVSVVGALQAWRTPPELRGELPWYASPWFWGPGLVVALLLVFKDPVLGLVPGAKKPLDAFDVLENKASALLAAPAVVPMFLSAATAARGLVPASAPAAPVVSQAGVAALPGFVEDLPRAILLGIVVAVFLVAFFCVWLAFHAINVLILLSPFGPLDTLLRMVKGLVLLVLVVATVIHPYLGVVVALVIVAVSVPLAAWSYRLMVFGGVLSLDLLTWRHRRTRVDPKRLPAFVARRFAGLSPRTYGRVSVTDHGICFSWRPWLVLPRRTLRLPTGSYHLGRGLVCPLVRWRGEEGATFAMLRLPPRYRYHDDELVAILALSGVEDLGFRRGVKAVVGFVKDMAGGGGTVVPAEEGVAPTIGRGGSGP